MLETQNVANERSGCYRHAAKISSLNSENSLSYGHFKELIFISMKLIILMLTNRNLKRTGAVITLSITKKARVFCHNLLASLQTLGCDWSRP